MMNKLWAFLSGVLGALSVFFYVSNKQKDKKIKRHKDEAERYKAEAEQQRYIAKSERTTKRIKDRIDRASESDIDRLLKQQGALRDESERS